MTLTKEEIKMVLSFLPKGDPDSIPFGLSPEFYWSLSYEGDVKIMEVLTRARNKLNSFLEET